MELTRQRKPRPKPLDLVRRAKLLNVSFGHLAAVIRGERQSSTLLKKFNKLLESENSRPKTSTK
jgi:hypothetical protein